MNSDLFKNSFGPTGASGGPSAPGAPTGPGAGSAAASAADGNEADAARAGATNLGRPLLWGWLTLVLGIGGFFTWAFLAPLDQGITAVGQVTVTGNRKTVQPLLGGKIAQILVKEDDLVKAGQPVVLMDATSARSQLDIALGQWVVMRAVEARLVAERLDRATIVYPADLLEQKELPAAREAMALQGQLIVSRRNALQSELAVISESIVGFESQIRGVEAAKASKEEQIKLLREELKGQRELASEGYLPRNRVSEQERLLAQLNGAVSEDLSSIARFRSAISELKMRQISRQREIRQQVEAQLTEVQKEVGSLMNRMSALRFDLANTEVRAPVDGRVVGLAVHTAGGVVQPGTPMMDIVPIDEPLKIDAQVPTHFIDKIRPGMDVDILFSAFNQRITPHVPGRLLKVSADALTDPKSGVPYYKAEVVVLPEGMKLLRMHEIRPGMPAEVFVQTGERSAMNYFVKPLQDRLRRAMTED